MPNLMSTSPTTTTFSRTPIPQLVFDECSKLGNSSFFFHVFDWAASFFLENAAHNLEKRKVCPFVLGNCTNEKHSAEFIGSGLMNQLAQKPFLIANNDPLKVIVENCSSYPYLHAAISNQRKVTFQKLLEYELDLNYEHNFFSPMHWAAFQTQSIFAKELHKKGVNLDIQNRFNQTPLHLAATNLNNAALDYFLTFEVDATARDITNSTPLHYWASGNSFFSLLKHYENYRTFPPERRLVEAKEKAFEKLISSGSDVNAKNIYNLTSLQQAVAFGQLPATRVLHKHGIDLKIKTDTGQGLLHLALAGSNLPEKLFFYDEPHFIKDAPIVGWFALEAEAQQLFASAAVNRFFSKLHLDRGKLVDFLLFKGTLQVDEKDNEGITPLHLAATFIGVPKESESPLEIFCKREVDLNLQDKEGRTPLHWLAAVSPQFFKFLDLQKVKHVEDNFELLLDNKANLNIRNKKGESPFETAVQAGNFRIATLLIEHGANFQLTSGVKKLFEQLKEHCGLFYPLSALQKFLKVVPRGETFNKLMEVLKRFKLASMTPPSKNEIEEDERVKVDL